jgi:transcription elongation GreA/GreB family factor
MTRHTQAEVWMRSGARSVPAGDYVAAAVHARSPHLDIVVARAVERARATGRQVILVTVLTQRPLRSELLRLRLALRRHSPPVHLVAARVDTERLDNRARINAISDELVRATVELGATELVIGHDPQRDQAAGTVADRVAVRLPAQIDLRFAVPQARPAAATASKPDGRPARPTGTPPPPPPLEAQLPHLTDEGRMQLARRAARIERDSLPNARWRLQQSGGAPSAVIELENQINQLRRLGDLVLGAPSTHTIPDDPRAVELGEQVTVQLAETGRRRRVVVVDPVEAVRGRACVSATSGLGRELLGGRIGDRVTVPTPQGPAEARIVAAVRTDP